MAADPEFSDPANDPHIEALLAEAGWVLALARRLARDQAAAEDIAQGTLTLALERRPSLGGGLRPWLGKVAGRLARRTLRSDSRRKAREAQAAGPREATGGGSDEVLERFEMQQELARRVHALHEPYRGVLIRRYFEGLSVQAIAKASGASPATVRSQLARGLERLRLQHDHEFESLGALGVFLIAAGGGSGFLSRRTAQLALMQTSTKLAMSTAVVLGGALLVGVGLRGSSSQPARDASATAPLEAEAQPSGPMDPVRHAAIEPPAPATERLAQRAGPAPGSAEPAAAAPEEDQASLGTTVRARLLGDAGQPLAGARLSSIHPDGRPRGANNSTLSDASGLVGLELEADAVRRWRDQPFEMLFRAEANGHATSFVSKQPQLRGRTDLGEIRLAPGGVLLGRCVDALGNPVPGATLQATVGLVAEDLGTRRITGPGSEVPRPHTVSAADGSFELAGLRSTEPDGRVATMRVWAHAPGHLWTRSEPFSVSPGSPVDLGRIVLEVVPPEMRIEGIVLRPDGRAALLLHPVRMATHLHADGRDHGVRRRRRLSGLVRIACRPSAHAYSVWRDHECRAPWTSAAARSTSTPCATRLRLVRSTRAPRPRSTCKRLGTRPGKRPSTSTRRGGPERSDARWISSKTWLRRSNASAQRARSGPMRARRPARRHPPHRVALQCT